MANGDAAYFFQGLPYSSALRFGRSRFSPLFWRLPLPFWDCKNFGIALAES
jgi:hypothetical protein